MLTSEQIEWIVVDYMTKAEKPRVTGADAEAFLEEFKIDEELAKQNGWTIELPFEL